MGLPESNYIFATKARRERSHEDFSLFLPLRLRVFVAYVDVRE